MTEIVKARRPTVTGWLALIIIVAGVFVFCEGGSTTAALAHRQVEATSNPKRSIISTIQRPAARTMVVTAVGSDGNVLVPSPALIGQFLHKSLSRTTR